MVRATTAVASGRTASADDADWHHLVAHVLLRTPPRGACELVFRLESNEADPDGQRRRLTCRKCRPAAKPDPKWWRITFADGLLDLAPVDPFEGGSGRRAPVREEQSEQLLDALTVAGPILSWAAWARAAEVDPKHGTPRRARNLLLDQGLAVEDTGGGYRAAPEDGSGGARCHPSVGGVALDTPNNRGRGAAR